MVKNNTNNKVNLSKLYSKFENNKVFEDIVKKYIKKGYPKKFVPLKERKKMYREIFNGKNYTLRFLGMVFGYFFSHYNLFFAKKRRSIDFFEQNTLFPSEEKLLKKRLKKIKKPFFKDKRKQIYPDVFYLTIHNKILFGVFVNKRPKVDYLLKLKILIRSDCLKNEYCYSYSLHPAFISFFFNELFKYNKQDIVSFFKFKNKKKDNDEKRFRHYRKVMDKFGEYNQEYIYDKSEKGNMKIAKWLILRPDTEYYERKAYVNIDNIVKYLSYIVQDFFYLAEIYQNKVKKFKKKQKPLRDLRNVLAKKVNEIVCVYFSIKGVIESSYYYRPFKENKSIFELKNKYFLSPSGRVFEDGLCFQHNPSYLKYLLLKDNGLKLSNYDLESSFIYILQFLFKKYLNKENNLLKEIIEKGKEEIAKKYNINVSIFKTVLYSFCFGSKLFEKNNYVKTKTGVYKGKSSASDLVLSFLKKKNPKKAKTKLKREAEQICKKIYTVFAPLLTDINELSEKLTKDKRNYRFSRLRKTNKKLILYTNKLGMRLRLDASKKVNKKSVLYHYIIGYEQFIVGNFIKILFEKKGVSVYFNEIDGFVCDTPRDKRTIGSVHRIIKSRKKLNKDLPDFNLREKPFLTKEDFEEDVLSLIYNKDIKEKVSKLFGF